MKTSAQSILATGVILLANLLAGVVAARVLLPEGRGALAAIILWPALLGAVGSLGFGQAVTYFCAGSKGRAKDIAAFAMATSLLLAVLTAVVGIFIVPRVLASYPAAIVSLGLLYLAFVPLNYLGVILVAAFQGSQQFERWNLLRVTPQVSYAACVLVLAWLDLASVHSLVVASLAANGLTVAAGLAMWRPRRGELHWPDRKLRIDFLRYGWRVHIPTLINLANSRAGSVVIALFLSPADLGMFVVAVSASGLVSAGAATFGQLVFPRVAYESSPAEKVAVFSRYLRVSLLSTLVGAVALVATASWLVPLVFGVPFADAVALTQILCLGAVFSALRLICANGLMAQARLAQISRAESVGLVAQVGGLLILLPQLGVIGAGWSFVLAQALPALMLAVSVSNGFGCSVISLMRPTWADWLLVKQAMRPS